MNNPATITLAKMVEEGRICAPRFFCPEITFDGPSGIDGLIVERYRQLCEGKKAIVFCNTVEHAEHTAARFIAAGIPATTVLGSHNHAVREADTERFRKGEMLVLVTVTVLMDARWPEVDAVIIAAPTASRTKFFSQVSCALTPRFTTGMPQLTSDQRRASIAASDKPDAIVLDVAGNCLRLGVADL
jgi:hypothetical protein